MSINLNKSNRNRVSLQKEGNAVSPVVSKDTKIAEKEEGRRSKWLFAIPILIVLALYIFVGISRDDPESDEGEQYAAGAEELLGADELTDTDEKFVISDESKGLDAADERELEEPGETETVEIQKEDPAAEGSGSQSIGEGYVDDASIHRYEVITANVTWSEAFTDCIARGGYLCRINSSEENDVIKDILESENIRGVVYLGGMRESDSREYHWVDSEKIPFDDILNEGKYCSFWYNGEPSYTDTVNDREIEELYMSILYSGTAGGWVWNDVNDDVLSLAPDYYTGKLSYICEFE